MRRYNHSIRWMLALIVIALLVIGTVQNPAAVVSTLISVPLAFTQSFIWVVAVLVLVWLFTDLFSKYLLGKSLREQLEDKDPTFERNLTLVLVIVMVLAMLIAK